MSATENAPPFIYMAPLKGITDALFRRVYFRHFGGVDAVVAPFINPQRRPVPTSTLLADVLPENNSGCPRLIPQLINNDPEDFLRLGDAIGSLGYQEVNWNLGCPVAMVARKRRGSGLLPFPDQIERLLEQILPRLSLKLSIKMRLGYDDFGEARELLPRLDRYPLSSIIIHARLGRQLYRGSTAPEEFKKCCCLSRHPLVYNGDLVSVTAYEDLRRMLPEVGHWMIGRGLIADPWLPGRLKQEHGQPETKSATLRCFHDELYQALQHRLSGPGHPLGRMKQIWIYFIGAFPGREKQLKRIVRAGSERSYLTAVAELFGD